MHSVPYTVLCKTFEKCENTTKRLEITEHLVRLFVKVIDITPEGLLELLYMCINKVWFETFCALKHELMRFEIALS